MTAFTLNGNTPSNVKNARTWVLQVVVAAALLAEGGRN